MPLMVPVDELSEVHAGRVPLTMLQLYGGIPPVAWIFCLYAVSTAPSGSDVVVMERGSTTTVMFRLAEAVSGGLPESATCTLKLARPPAVGVPEIVPSLPKLNPAGREPAVS